MAIDIKFDLVGNPEPPTIILANRNGNKLGQLKVDTKSIDLSDKLNDISEFSFVINKYTDNKLVPLWDKVVDFKLIYCKEWDAWFEINVELDEDTKTAKTVFCKYLGHAELSQIMLYDIEINTEKDIERDDYKISILYDMDDPESSILNRIMRDKAPHYKIAYVSPTIAKIQRSFSFNDTSILDAHQEIAKEIGCLFQYRIYLDKDGVLQRDIYVFDLQQNCNSCNHRGEFTDKCPKCGSTNITNGYGEDTLIFVTSDELATNGIRLVTDVDSVKNCFKLEAGDDLMTATIRNCNPNGTDYIWYFSDSFKEDMPDELVEKLESYDETYRRYNSEYVSYLNEGLLSGYNSLVEKYSVYNEDLQKITPPIAGYSALMNAYYNTVDLGLYLESGLMPNIKMSETDAKKQASLLTASSMSPVAVSNLNIVSLATANSVVLSMARIVVKSTYKVEIKTSELYGSGNAKYWRGSFIVTNYSDKEDTAESSTISVALTDDLETITKQKIEKVLNKENTDNLSITGLFDKSYNDFRAELRKYGLKPLTSFYEACQACIDILIEQGIGNSNSWYDGSGTSLYNKLYVPYYNKLKAIESEMKIREDEIKIVLGAYDNDGNLVSKGLQNNIEECQKVIQDALNFESYIGNKLCLEFCSYRREDKYSNDNYISDGLNNAELFKRAQEFIEVANNEIYKSSELQHSISTTLNNLLAIPKFKELVKYFKVGNWIRVQVDNEIYKLRLLEYKIDYGNFEKIPVEFSDVTKVKNGITDVKDILSQASSIATSYDSVKRQAEKGDKARSTIDQWVVEGLNSALVQIQSNDNEDITLTKNGLLCRSYDEITESYSPKQLKLTHNILAYTDDDWESVRLAIGEHKYKAYSESADNFVDRVGYGFTADFVTAGVVSGSQIIGGEIYSDNYSIANGTGSYLDLRNGYFNFGGGKITFDGDKLVIKPDEGAGITEEMATEIASNAIKTATITASQIDTKGLIAEDISTKVLNSMTINTSDFVGGTIALQSDGSISTFTMEDLSGYVSIDLRPFVLRMNGAGGELQLYSGGNKDTPPSLKIWDDNNNQITQIGTYESYIGCCYFGYDGELEFRDGAGSSAMRKGYIGYGNSEILSVYNDAYPMISLCSGVGGNAVNFSYETDGENRTLLTPSVDSGAYLGTTSLKWNTAFFTNAITASDLKEKQVLSDFDFKAKEFIMGLKPIAYNRIGNGDTGKRIHMGFGAQDVSKLINDLQIGDLSIVQAKIINNKSEAAYYGEDIDDKKLSWGINYNEFIAPLIALVQTQQVEIDELNQKINNLIIPSST